MHLVTLCSFTRGIVFMLLIVAITTVGSQRELRAQQPSTTIALSAVQFALDRLAPGTTSGEAIFLVDTANTISVEIIASLAGLDISIEGPGGQIVDQNTIDALGGTFLSIEGIPESNLDLILSSNTPGFHTNFTFPSFGPGNYIVQFAAPPNLAEEVAVITQVLTDSPVGVTLIATSSPLLLGDPAVLTAVLFEGMTPVAGATIMVDIQPETGGPVTLTLLDDGGPADDVAGDGLYSAEFIPSTPGRYKAVAAISGTTTGGLPFNRQAATQFTVVTPTASLPGTVVDQGLMKTMTALLNV